MSDAPATTESQPGVYRPHPLANLFPLIEGDAYWALVADIRAHGVREPVVMFDGMVLDGRNRYLAARECGAAIQTVEYRGDDPLGFVVSLNLHRRHLDASQRAMVASKIAALPVGANQHVEISTPTQSEAAALLNVSRESVISARRVQEHGTLALIAEVEAGHVSVSAAAEVAKLPEAEQFELVARGKQEIIAKARELQAADREASRVERVERIAAISRGNAPLGTDARYPVILADPPWRYDGPALGSPNRAVENHYPTMALEEICVLPVRDLASDDAVLFLWATAPMLAEAMKVIEAWGFTYRTQMVWGKDKFGLGYFVRNQHENLLIAKRGEIPHPAPADRPSSLLHAPRGAHSAKPVQFHRLIERMYPDLPRIELFCRTPQPGWAVWGNQAAPALQKETMDA